MVSPVGTKDGAATVEGNPTSQPAQQTSEKTYTQVQLDEQVRNAKSDVLAEVGRLRKSSEEASKQAQAAQARLDRMMKEQEDAELEAARDRPDTLAALRERQARRKAEVERDQARQESDALKARFAEAETQTVESRKMQTAAMIAAKYGVDPERLAKLTRFSDGTPEAIEEVAKELPKKETKPPLHVDSGGHVGGLMAWEQVRDAYIKDPRNPAIKERYLEMRRERGR